MVGHSKRLIRIKNSPGWEAVSRGIMVGAGW